MSAKVLIAIIIVALLAGGGYFADQYFFKGKNPQNQTSLSIQPVTSEPVSLTLDLSSPNDNLLVFDPDLLIQGATTPGAIVITSINNNNYVLDINSKGEFSSTIKLTEGVNQIMLSAFDSVGNGKTESRTIYYSKEKL